MNKQNKTDMSSQISDLQQRISELESENSRLKQKGFDEPTLLTATSSLRDALDLLDQPNNKLLMNIISERAKAIEEDD